MAAETVLALAGVFAIFSKCALKSLNNQADLIPPYGGSIPPQASTNILNSPRNGFVLARAFERIWKWFRSRPGYRWLR